VRSRYVVVWVVLLVALNAAMVWYLRDRFAHPPESSASSATPWSPPPSADTSTAVDGPVLMAGATDGSLIQVARGDCEGREQARTWVALGTAPAEQVTVPGLSEALAVGLTEAGWWVIGTDATCAVTAWSSVSRAGTEWRTAKPPVDAWFLDPASPGRVRSPRGPVRVASGCEATWVQAVGQQVYALCADGRALSTDRTTRQFVPIDGAEAVVAMAAAPGGTLALLTTTPECVAGVRTTVDGAATDESCISESQEPLGVAWTGDTLVAQVDTHLRDQSNGWQPRL
jgi:hypothetical protein